MEPPSHFVLQVEERLFSVSNYSLQRTPFPYHRAHHTHAVNSVSSTSQFFTHSLISLSHTHTHGGGGDSCMNYGQNNAFIANIFTRGQVLLYSFTSTLALNLHDS